MGTTITHNAAQPAESWTETIEGATPNSVAVSLTAKGQAQFDIKLTYQSPHDMRVAVADELAAIIEQVKIALEAVGIPLAGQNGSNASASATEGK